jgi:insulysin
MLKKSLLLFCFLILSSCMNEKNDAFEKHPLDESKSRTVTLSNGLRVYLLSDPKFNVSAASMVVEVGSLDNPKDREGTAHFLEHMLFLGTKKFPDVDEYSEYLRTFGGYANAYTASDHTNYQLQVLPDGYEGAIDRFSQFFIAPLFTAEYTEREVNAVNSEHQKNMMNDNWRQYRVSSLFAKEDHPSRKFGTGSLETIGDITRDELVNFYEQHYSSNRMGLALLSNHSLDDLEVWAKKYFTSIKNRKLKRNYHDPVLFDKKETFRLVRIDPVKDIRDLQITYPILGTREMYENKPGRQLGFIVGHEGEGSLLSYLKNKGWALSLSAGAGSDTKEYGMATIKIGLTPKGLKEYKEVVKTTLNYIELMKTSGYQTHVYNELKSMAELEYVYGSKGEGMWRATQLANEAMMYPLKDAGKINYIYRKNEPEHYESLLRQLTPDNMLVVLTAKGLKTDKIEHHYQAPYSYEEDDNFYKTLIKKESIAGLTIPKENPFIPKSASVPNRKIIEGKLPELISEQKGHKLYFGLDHEFLRPKGVINLKILLPKELMSVNHRVYSKLYSACVNESLNEISYPAKQAGLNYSFREGYEGFFVTVSGYSESAISLYEMLLNHMVDFSITEDQFSAIKDKTIRGYENFSLSDAHQQTRERGYNIYDDVKYSWEESLPIAQTATLSKIKEYAQKIYEKTFTEAFIYGDFTEFVSKEALNSFKKETGTLGISREDAFDIKYLVQPNPESLQYVDRLKVNNSCFYREYNIGKDTPKNRAKSLVISQAIQQPFYTEMRTNQQLGYIVWSYPRLRENTHYLAFVIQSGEYSALELSERASKLIYDLPSIVNSLDDETFQQLKNSAIEKLEKRPMSIAERSGKLKNLIFEFNGDYSRDKKTIEALRSLKKKEAVESITLAVSDDTKKMVNFMMFAKQHEMKKDLKSSFKDLNKWKKTRKYK